MSVSGSKKAALVELCEAVHEMNIGVDPDGLVEDHAEIIQEKLL